MVKVLTFKRGAERIDLYQRPNGEQMAVCHVREDDGEHVVALWASSVGTRANRASA